MPRKVKAMKFRGFYCSEELWEQMKRAAIKADESDSEYIREAIKGRIELEPLSKEIKKIVSMETSEPIQSMDLVAEKDGKAVKPSNLDKALSKGPEYPKPESKKTDKKIQTFFK